MSSEVKKWKEDRPISIAFIGAGAVNFGGAEGVLNRAMMHGLFYYGQAHGTILNDWSN